MSSRKEMDHDFELNIASIVDCFTVLITYLLAAASFISLGMIPAESLVDRTNVTDAQINTEATAQLTVEVLEGHKIRFSVWNGNNAQKEEFSLTGDAAELEKATLFMGKLKEAHPKLDQAIMVSDPTVSYGDFIQSAELVKKQFKIYLANNSDGSK